MRLSTMMVSASLMLALGCADQGDRAPAPDDDKAVEAAAEVAPAETGPWRDRVAATLERLERERPDALALLLDLEPHPTRARTLRFAGEPLRDPDAAAVLLHRLAQGGEPPAQRAAIADALPRTGGVFADAIPELLASEGDAAVRAALVASVWRAPKADALATVRAGFADDDALVRAAAARTAERHDAGAAVSAELRRAASDRDPRVRAAAVRALGIHQVASAADVIAAQVGDADADVRLQSLRALDRVGADAVAIARELRGDPDPRVRRLATRMITATR